MKTKSEQNSQKDSFAFYAEVGRLKSLPRTGWVNRRIRNPETVAAHMYRSQFIAYDLAKEFNQNGQACAHMMMIHDLPEARSGDITPDCNISKSQKAAKEYEAAKYLTKLSGNPEFLSIFCEYEEKRTLRSRVCGDADQLEALFQALEYSELYPHKRKSLEGF